MHIIYNNKAQERVLTACTFDEVHISQHGKRLKSCSNRANSRLAKLPRELGPKSCRNSRKFRTTLAALPVKITTRSFLMVPSATDTDAEGESAPKTKRKRNSFIKVKPEYTESGPILKELKPGSPVKSSPIQTFQCEEDTENIDPSASMAELNLEEIDHCGASDVPTAASPDFEVNFVDSVHTFSAWLTSPYLSQYFIKSTAGVPISALELVLRPVRLVGNGYDPKAQQMRVVLQVRKTNNDGHEWCYDIDIGYRSTCHKVQRSRAGAPFQRCGYAEQSAYSLLVLRKSYFARVRRVGPAGEKFFAYPNTIVVSSVRYMLHHCAGDEDFCYAVSHGDEFRLVKLLGQTIVIPTAVPAHPTHLTGEATFTTARANVMLVVPGPSAGSLGEFAAAAELSSRVGFELPIDFSPAAQMRGKVLWEPFYGEVYKGHLLKRSKSLQTSDGGAVFDFQGAEAVAIKVMRHLNDHSGPVDAAWHNVEGSRYVLPLLHHQIPAQTVLAGSSSSAAAGDGSTSPLRTTHMSPHFEAECTRGKNENLVNEIEIMFFIARSIARLAENLNGFDSDETATALLQRFFPMLDVALCSNNLFVVTKYTAFGNLLTYKDRSGFNRNLDERCCQHIIAQVLQGLHFLHERGIAHQDISLENTLLQAPLKASDDLMSMCEQLLSQENFLKMDVVIIDMGHVAAHEPLLQGDAIRHSASNVSNISSATADTDTTCESTSGRSHNMDVCSECASPTPQPKDDDAKLPKKAVHAHRFQSRCAGLNCVGKRLYHCPELSPSAASARAMAKAAVAAALAERTVSASSTAMDVPANETVASAAVQTPTPQAPAPVFYCGMCVDMWQVGVLLIYLITGRPPYEFFSISDGDKLRNEITWFEDIALGRLAERPVAWRDENFEKRYTTLQGFLSPDCFDLLRQLLAFEPDQRISADKALQHPWLKNLSDN